jgi:hypothetical protein
MAHAPAAKVAVAGLLLACGTAAALDDDLLSASVQARIGERTVLGQDSPESFKEYDLRASLRTRWERPLAGGLSVGMRWLASVGAFEGVGQWAAVASLVPVLALGTDDRRFTLDGGIGLALLSKHHFGQQDLGGPLQFALTAGLEGPVYRRIGLGYRFMHYSDAGAWGPHTIGADLHMAGLTYRF